MTTLQPQPQNELTLDGVDSGLQDFIDVISDSEVDGADGVAPEEGQQQNEPGYNEALQAKEEELNRRQAELDRQQEEAQRAREAQEFEQRLTQSLTARYNQMVRSEYQELLDQGLSESVAAQKAQQIVLAQLETAQSKARAIRDKQTLVAHQEGVPLIILQGVTDEAAMRERARNYKATGGPAQAQVDQLTKEVAELRAQLQKRGVPAQDYHQTGSVTGSNSRSQIQAYAEGRIPWNKLPPQVQEYLRRSR